MTRSHRDPPYALRDLAIRAILFLAALGYALSLISCGVLHP